MGVEHGAYCAGCCWALMAVLVVVAEKLLPWGQWATRVTGIALLGFGTLVALQPQLAFMLRGQMR